MPRQRGKDSVDPKGPEGRQPEGPSEHPSSRAPQNRQPSRQEKRQRLTEELLNDAAKTGTDIDAHAQSVGKHPKGRP